MILNNIRIIAKRLYPSVALSIGISGCNAQANSTELCSPTPILVTSSSELVEKSFEGEIYEVELVKYIAKDHKLLIEWEELGEPTNTARVLNLGIGKECEITSVDPIMPFDDNNIYRSADGSVTMIMEGSGSHLKSTFYKTDSCTVVAQIKNLFPDNYYRSTFFSNDNKMYVGEKGVYDLGSDCIPVKNYE